MGVIDATITADYPIASVFIKNGEKQQIAFVKGVDYNYTDVVGLDDAIQVGTWLQKEYTNTSIIGNSLAYKLSAGIESFGEYLEILVPKTGTGFLNPAQSFRSINTQIVGTYFGTEDFENNYVFVSNSQAQELLNYKADQFTGIEIKLRPEINADDFSEQLQEKLGAQYKVQTKVQLNELFYKVINTENFVSYLIFTLIVIIAMFTIVGAIIMMIIDKKANLKTLFNLGATIKEIKRIFIIQGFLLTFLGMCIGLLLGVALVFLQKKFEIFMIVPNLAYPVEFRITNLLIVFFTITILGFIAAKIASSRISEEFID